MSRRKIFLCITILCCFVQVFSQNGNGKLSVQDYIEKYKRLALWEMKEYKIPVSIILAQGIIETNCGNSRMAKEANNHFGIKCHKDWTGNTFFQDDDTKNECFRSYKNEEESFRDHGIFLTTRPRYAFLFQLDMKDYKLWAQGLQKSGYATNPSYAASLIRVIEENHLYDIDFEQQVIAQTWVDTAFCNRYLAGYNQPLPSRFTKKSIEKNGRVIYTNNGLKMTFARSEESLFNIANDLNISLRQLCWYNDLSKNDCPAPGQIIYLAKKKRKAEAENYVVKDKDNMFSISQLHGIKLKSLYKYNHLSKGQEPKTGDTLWLKRH